jgi:hypothetical protein
MVVQLPLAPPWGTEQSLLRLIGAVLHGDAGYRMQSGALNLESNLSHETISQAVFDLRLILLRNRLSVNKEKIASPEPRW